MGNIIAVCDKEKEYAHRLMEYMNEKNSFVMKATAFSNEENVEEYASYKKIECMLISENMMSEKVRSVNAGRKIVLRENAASDGSSEYKEIFKYQSAEKIVREVMSLYEAEKIVSGTDDNKDSGATSEKRVIGVYSPVYCPDKTAFALELCKECAQYSSSLYINLESFSGMGEMIGHADGCNLGDLLYYAGNTGVDLAAKLTGSIVSVRGIDIIPPVQSPDDISGVYSERFKALFSTILSKTSYETIVLDFGNDICDICEIIRFCTRIFIPQLPDMIAKARLNDFDEYIRTRDIDEKKIRKINIPQMFETETDFDETRNVSIFSEFVHTIMQGEEPGV